MRSVLDSVNQKNTIQTSLFISNYGNEKVVLDSIVVREKESEAVPLGNFHLIHDEPQPTLSPQGIVYFTCGMTILETTIIFVMVLLCYIIKDWADWIASWSNLVVIFLSIPAFGISFALFPLQVIDNRVFMVNYVLKGITSFWFSVIQNYASFCSSHPNTLCCGSRAVVVHMLF